MKSEKPQLYFERDTDWYDWLLTNQHQYEAVYLIFYKKETNIPSMTWEEAVRVALCFGWIDSTVKSLGDGKRQQYFCKRKPKSVWSKVNKNHIAELIEKGLLQESGYKSIQIAKENGSWTELDDVENLVIPEDLQKEFDKNKLAFDNYKNFAPSYRKNYLYWLHSAKRTETRTKRIQEIIQRCENNSKQR